jgi:hypothetical protein
MHADFLALQWLIASRGCLLEPEMYPFFQQEQDTEKSKVVGDYLNSMLIDWSLLWRKKKKEESKRYRVGWFFFVVMFDAMRASQSSTMASAVMG